MLLKWLTTAGASTVAPLMADIAKRFHARGTTGLAQRFVRFATSSAVNDVVRAHYFATLATAPGDER